MAPILNRKVYSSFNQKIRNRWINTGDLGLNLQSCHQFSGRKNSKINVSLQVKVAKRLSKNGFHNSLENQFSANDLQTSGKDSELTFHISPPNSPQNITYSSSRKDTKNGEKRRKNITKDWPCEFETSQTPIISPPLSPTESKMQHESQFLMYPRHFSAQERKKQRVIKSAKRELFQDITITCSPNKCVTSNDYFEIGISPYQSPRKAGYDEPIIAAPQEALTSKRFILRSFSPRLQELNMDVEIYPSITPPKSSRKRIACHYDNDEQRSSAKKENTGSIWLNGITWQPKTPDKTDRNSVLTDSTKKRRYHVSGGFAQRLKQLEMREQTALNLQRHLVSSKNESSVNICVKALNLSCQALPLAKCQDISTSEELLIVIPQIQVPNIVIGSTLMVPRSCIETSRTGLLTFAPENIEILKPDEASGLARNSPKILYKWQCLCRNDTQISNLTCPENLTSFHKE